MIEKFLELILHAKAGAISGIFLIGASGALVSATTQNGVTTITVTQASPSPSASASPSAGPSASPSASPSVSPSASPSARASASPSASPRSDRACVEATQAVNEAFKRHHGALAKLHGRADDRGKGAKEDAKQALKQADELLKGIRKAAVKAIHESCGTKHDDDDEDDEDEDEDSDKDKDEDDKDKDRTHSRAAVNIAFTGTPSQMAQQAATAMEIVMGALKTKLDALPTATPKATPTRTPKPSLRPTAKPSKSPHASAGHSRG